jgi:phage terminase Nu1 subunit (DNA packaging protein)
MKKLIVTPEGTFELELTAEDIAQRQLDEQQAEQDRLAYEQKKTQELTNKQSALNKLKALGLNDAEIKSIIG